MITEALSTTLFAAALFSLAACHNEGGSGPPEAPPVTSTSTPAAATTTAAAAPAPAAVAPAPASAAVAPAPAAVSAPDAGPEVSISVDPTRVSTKKVALAPGQSFKVVLTPPTSSGAQPPNAKPAARWGFVSQSRSLGAPEDEMLPNGWPGFRWSGQATRSATGDVDLVFETLPEPGAARKKLTITLQFR